MKYIFRLASLFLLITASFFTFSPAQAIRSLQDSTPEAGFAMDDDPAMRVDFPALGVTQAIFLQGPLAQADIAFSLPPEWKLKPGAVLNFDATVLISNFLVGQEIYNLTEVNAGEINVTLNGVFIGSEILQGGGLHRLQFAIPDSAFASNLQELVIEWDATSSCDQNIAASISINTASFFYLPHENITPPLRLDAYPSPFYLPNNPLSHPVTLAIADGASQAVVQGAVQVAASLGRISRGKIQMSVVPASQLAESRHADSNLILVGSQDAFLPARSLALPAPPNPADGILELFKSPWNNERLILLVTGASDEAILKAASALSAGQVLASSRDNTAFVAELWYPIAPVFKQDQLFSDLGAGAMKFTSFGTSSQEILFNIPPGKSIGADAYLDLIFNHSQLLDYLRSGIQVSINDIPIGSIRLSDASSNLNTVRLIVPASAIKTGTNRLSLQVQITPRSACTDPRQGSLFVTIFPDSFLHLPVTDSPIVSTVVFELGAFPSSFLNKELNETTFHLSADDPASWAGAARLAFELGTQDTGSFFPLVTFVSDGQAIDFSTGHHIVIGQPGRAPAIAALESVLPIAFDVTGQLTAEAQTRLVYAIDPTRSAGFLEITTAPGVSSSLLLLVAGNNDQGLGWAVSALSNPTLRAAMKGANFAVAQSGAAIKSQYVHKAGLQAEALIPGATPVPPGLTGSTTDLPPRKDLWAIPVIVIAVLGIAGLIIWEVISWKRSK